MKKEDVKVGMLVVVTKRKDATIYKVAAVDGFNARLEYRNESGRTVQGGLQDSSNLRKPTEKQLEVKRLRDLNRQGNKLLRFAMTGMFK